MLEALILGIIQGLTEFFPISSSGHLLILPKVVDALGADLDFDFQNTMFDLVLHLATFFVIVIAYRQKIWEIAVSYKQKSSQNMIRNAIITTIPAGILAVTILITDGEKYVKDSKLAIAMMILVGLALIYVEFRDKLIPLSQSQKTPTEHYSSLNPKQSFIIGLFQALSLVRGVSRSGITLIGGISNGLSRKDALDYAFLASIPVFLMLTASLVLDFAMNGNNTDASAGQLIIGFFSALLSGLVVIYIFRQLINKRGALAAFGIYRIILGIIALIVLY